MDHTASTRKRCVRCGRARMVLALAGAVLALALLPMAWLQPGASAADASTPAPSAGPVTPQPAAPASVALQPPVPAASAPELIRDKLVLARLVLGQEWAGLPLVRYGSPPYALRVIKGEKPPEMAIGADGWLRGTPQTVKTWDFVVRLGEGELAPTQRYLIEVARTAAPRKPAKVRSISAHAAAALIDPAPDMPRTWLLTGEEGKKLQQPEEVVGGDPDDPPPERPPLPTEDQLQAILSPLLNKEFLSDSQMSQALDASVCEVFKAQMQAHGVQTKQAVDETCPPSEGGPRNARSKLAGSKGAASSPKPAPARSPDKDLSLAEFHAELMPPGLRARILKLAEKPHAMTQIRPVTLAASAGCGCNKPTLAGEVIGLMGYWHAAPKPQQVNFRDVTRLNFLGGVLGERGTFAASWEGLPDGLDFTRLAQRHGTPVDLVLYARHWSHLQVKTAGERKAFVHTAVESALMLARRELQDDTAQFQRRLLNPAWRETDRAFDGITLMFEGGLVGSPDEGVYREFVQQFVAQLIERMRNSDRRGWRLNLLIADDRVDVDPTYSLEWMWNTWKSTLHDPQHAEDAEHPEWARRLLQDKAVEGEHSTDIELRYLVTVREPTTRYKKELRARLDAATNLKGIRRVALLRNMRPVLLHSREGPVDVPPPERRDQLNDDLIYGSWNFNGVGLWPLPVEGLGQGSFVNKLLQRIYGAPPSSRPGEDQLCDWTCPHRIGLRTTLQWLLLALTISLVGYAASCDVRRLGKPLLGAMLVMTAVVAAIFAALLICDPDMEVWRARMPAITTVVALVLFIVAAWQLLHKRVAPR